MLTLSKSDSGRCRAPMLIMRDLSETIPIQQVDYGFPLHSHIAALGVRENSHVHPFEIIGQKQRDQAKRHDRSHEAIREEHAEVALRSQQRLPECLLGLVAEDNGEHQRRHGMLHFFMT